MGGWSVRIGGEVSEAEKNKDRKSQKFFVRMGGKGAERKFRRGKGLCLGLIKKKGYPVKVFTFFTNFPLYKQMVGM